jgi:hypothetical protein
MSREVSSENVTSQPELIHADPTPEMAAVTQDIPVPSTSNAKQRTSQLSAKDIEFAKFSHMSKGDWENRHIECHVISSHNVDSKRIFVSQMESLRS